MYFKFLMALTAIPIFFKAKKEILLAMLNLKNLGKIIDVF